MSRWPFEKTDRGSVQLSDLSGALVPPDTPFDPPSAALNLLERGVLSLRDKLPVFLGRASVANLNSENLVTLLDGVIIGTPLEVEFSNNSGLNGIALNFA